MRNPFHSEQEAFRFVLVLILVLAAIALAVAFTPAWLAYVVVAVIPAAVAVRVTQLRMRRLRGFELPVKMAPPHVGSPEERRVLLVANEALAEESVLAELARLGSQPHTHVLVLAPALVSGAARLSGAFEGPMDEARTRVRTALEHVGNERVVAGEITDAPPLEAIEDAFATFSPDEVIVATGWEHSPGALEPQLAGLVRERFAVPVRHLVIAPGAEAREPSIDTEWRYRRESGEVAAKQFGLKALAGAGIVAAVLMSAVALVHSGEKNEARAASRASAEQLAGLPRVASSVSLKVIAEYKPGPEGEKHDAFTVTEFAVHAGQPQQLKIDNTDTVPHSITAPGAGVNITIMPGVHTYTLDVKTPGRYLWFCTFVCDEWAMEHPGYMSGYITVS
jgi:plastocyanin